ncbi:hypothetical protein ABPG74_010294 [Tetrahymena malaccensis]
MSMSQTLCNFSVTNPSQILNHPLNTSKSKHQYSFSKSNRFDKNKSYCSEAYYNQKDQKEKRSAAFGYGTKSDFTKTQVYSPSPDQYEMKSAFEKQRSSQRGKSFGLSRDNMKEFSYITQGPLKNPGPGNYQFQETLRTEGFSMRPKTTNLYNPVFLDGKQSYQTNPGPGSYVHKDTITKLGRQTISNFRSSGATTFNPPTSKRFGPIKSAAPGPGTYQPKNDLNSSGQYVLSYNRGDGTRAFSNQARKSFTDIQANKSFTPGPGNYRIPSDFGNYDHINLYKTSSDFNSTKRSFNKHNTSNLY